MGVVNVTPDSFSDGGALSSIPDAAIAHGLALAAAGAAVHRRRRRVDPARRAIRSTPTRSSAGSLPVVAALVGADVRCR